MDQLENATSALNETMATHGDRLDVLETEISVSFSAVRTTNVNVNQNPVIFNDVRQNEGNGYDSGTGINANSFCSYLLLILKSHCRQWAPYTS